VSRDFERALNDADRDPEGAITSACATVESVCKCLLEQLEKPYPVKKDISHLVQEVQKHLDLSPARLDILSDVKQIMTGLPTVAGGIGALRTHGGDAHGRGFGITSSEPAVARLAIHAASTLSLFLLEAWQRRISAIRK
jgi:Abortive infection C-terminus